ncbi:molecular chaperone DnaJ [Malaciobacter molluscorum LMG 25693]|uniref:Chaperone protein DnaJ n=1 Tax=Malaciobacter molluscorum LMG 25693 TaxID=870501 RepID=A0A2G1DI74_9BACT|nr:molecular chaperone DnaJ [Malaciobacter molluscorum]AXX92346.1 DnaK system heat shock co-chaperone [Malaciobacter molluscorum LMG 25693]PHO18203.1 molecular chaperone DnaJ [Malaciobacter molluscorum LMG 25693]
MTEIDYYELLGISKDADKSTIKKAYRKMAMKYHPDKNPDDTQAEEKFKAINEAYQMLSDEEKRAIYDRYGKAGLEGHGQSGGFSSAGFDDLSSIFEEMFGSAFSGGGGFGSRRQRKSYNYNLDIGIEVQVEFNEAVFGSKKDITYKYKDACSTCKGTGAKDGKLSTCSTCQGQGQVHMRQGFMTFAQTCPNCHGTGEAKAENCKKCSGTGYHEKEETFEVNIPEGVNDGNRIRVSKKGNIAPDGSRGDLYIQISVKEDSHFVRHGDDIYIEIPLFFTQVALGGKIKIPGLRNELELIIPQGTKDKQQFTFKNEGVKSVQGYGKGDLIVQIKITYPKSLNNEQKQLLEKLQESFGIESKPHESSFENMFDKVKKWFS